MLWKDARAAAAVCAVIVVLSVFLGVYRSISAEADKLETMFYEGVDGSGYGIWGDLADRVEYAGILLKIAQKYDGAEVESAALEQAYLEYPEEDRAFSEYYEADKRLEEAVLALDLRLQELPLSEADERYRVQYTADFESRGLTMGREAQNFNAEVRIFEKKVLGGLVARLAGLLLPLPEVEAFS